MRLYDLLIKQPEFKNIEHDIAQKLNSLLLPAKWSLDCKEAIAIAIATSSSIGCKLLTTAEWTQFFNLLNKARDSYRVQASMTSAQNNLFSSVCSQEVF